MATPCYRRRSRSTSLCFTKVKHLSPPWPHDQQCGPTWFREPFPSPNAEKEKYIRGILMECFQLDPLWTRLSIGGRGIRLDTYQPNLVAKQFGLSQLLPKSLIPQEDCVFISIDNSCEENLTKCLNIFKDKPFYLPSFNFFLSFHCMEEFEDWWQSYYQSATGPMLMA